jgi:hypothetical protein
MSIRRALAILALALVTGASPNLARGDEPKASPDGWIPLFNGKDLEGWTPKIQGFPLGENAFDTFRVKDGAIQVNYDGYKAFDNRFGHLFYQAPFSHYKLRIEYRFTGAQCPGGPGWAFRNSGVMIHCQKPQTMRVDQDFPVCIEVQFLGGDKQGDRPTGNLCTPGTHVVYKGKLHTEHCTSSTSPTLRGDQWVTAEIEVHGAGRIIHRINGQEVLAYEQPQLDTSDDDARKLLKDDGDKLVHGGYLSLQAESHPVEFRKVEILPLEESHAEPK